MKPREMSDSGLLNYVADHEARLVFFEFGVSRGLCC